MTSDNNKRVRYRRYEDRRIAMMLAVYKILFDEPQGAARDRLILNAVLDNFKVDRVLLIDMDGGDAPRRIRTYVGKAVDERDGLEVKGAGFDKLLALHGDNTGALTFERVRRPNLFPTDIWESLWSEGMGAPARALLSMQIVPGVAPRQLLWLQQIASSREWGSRDRELIEEVAEVLAIAADKAVTER